MHRSTLTSKKCHPLFLKAGRSTFEVHMHSFMNCNWLQLLVEPVEEEPPNSQYSPSNSLYCSTYTIGLTHLQNHFSSYYCTFLQTLLTGMCCTLVPSNFFLFFICSTHSLGLARTGGGSLLPDIWVVSSSVWQDVSLCSSSSSSGSLKCTRRPTLELERESLWFVRVPVFRQELGGGSGRGTTMEFPFWWFGVPLTLGLVSGDVTGGLDTCSTEASHADREVKSFGYDSTSLPLCGSELAPLDPGGPWWR